MNILKLKETVKCFLVTEKDCRDNDNLLTMRMWQQHYSEDIIQLTAVDLLNDFAENKLPSFESITRCRRKLQELNEDLRGEKYFARMAEQENVKEQIKIFTK